MSHTTRFARTTLVVLTALLAVAVALPATALADTEVSGDSGEIGPHSLRDSEAKPGVKCIYTTDTDRLKAFEVRPPRLSSDDAFPSDVGWRVRVQRKGRSPSTWRTIFNSSIKHGTASDGMNANFSRRTISPPFPADNNPFFINYRIQIVMYQFYGDGSVAGKSVHRVDWYYSRVQGGTVAGGCEREIGVHGG